MAWPLTSKRSSLLFNVCVIHQIRFCIKKMDYSWAKCSFKIFHVLKNVILSSWPGLSCTKEQISHSLSVFSFMNTVDELSVMLIVDSERAEKAPNTDNEVKERPKEKKNRRTSELSLCNSVREPLQQVQQAGLFLSRSLNPDDNFLTPFSSVQYWLARRHTLSR